MRDLKIDAAYLTDVLADEFARFDAIHREYTKPCYGTGTDPQVLKIVSVVLGGIYHRIPWVSSSANLVARRSVRHICTRPSRTRACSTHTHNSPRMTQGLARRVSARSMSIFGQHAVHLQPLKRLLQSAEQAQYFSQCKLCA